MFRRLCFYDAENNDLSTTDLPTMLELVSVAQDFAATYTTHVRATARWRDFFYYGKFDESGKLVSWCSTWRWPPGQNAATVGIVFGGSDQDQADVLNYAVSQHVTSGISKFWHACDADEVSCDLDKEEVMTSQYKRTEVIVIPPHANATTYPVDLQYQLEHATAGVEFTTSQRVLYYEKV